MLQFEFSSLFVTTLQMQIDDNTFRFELKSISRVLVTCSQGFTIGTLYRLPNRNLLNEID